MIELARPPEPVRYRLTVDDYHAMAEAGILKREQRVELIEGDVIEMSPIGSGHSAVVGRLNKRLVLSVGDRALVWIQCSVRLSRHSEPQPDALILRPREDDYEQSLPTPDDVIVLVEVADSSLGYDRSTKLPLYARHGIEEVWLVNLRARQVEVYRGPEADGYAEKHTVGREGILQPAAMSDLNVPVADLLR
jgi:Uma2 family endonuclease